MNDFTAQDPAESLAVPPNINTAHINAQLGKAKELLGVYESEHHAVSRELESLQREEDALVALLGYVSCTEERGRILGFCTPHGEDYAARSLGLNLDKTRLAQYRNYRDLVSNRIDYERRHLEEVDQAISLLRKDIDFLNVIANSHFRGMLPLMTCRDRYWASLHLK
ncbi:hypothetical protein JSY17_10400 [Pseudomonas capsici]|uniref:hypothetical protein n=1 Tax=Pseudomonas capsici TaxID=2810614 RepID=UPI0019D0D6EC|nr:hypothetical protein [Pseudomonas capsici]MBN6714401.1 hypothetical protein [Pseudomonas capsici]MBN6719652.1 hypothetical protein [Pseudomonas capsici]MBN6724008.1 hypothetical protein [Pseudomonas capsici]